MKLPVTRSENIVVQELSGEILIYDLITNQAFCLNETAAIVYRACDGKTTFSDLGRRHRFSEDLIYLTLDQLREQNLLLAAAKESVWPYHGISRRDVIRKIGLTSMLALPLVSSIIAPTAAMAQSSTCLAPGAPIPGQTLGDMYPNCSDLPDASKSSFCDFIYGQACCSNHAKYAGNCTNFNPTIIHWTCSCA